MLRIKFTMIRTLLLFVMGMQCSILFGSTSSNEQHLLDSLNIVSENSNASDTSRAMAFYAMSDILYYSNPDTVIPLCKKSIGIVSRLKN